MGMRPSSHRGKSVWCYLKYLFIFDKIFGSGFPVSAFPLLSAVAVAKEDSAFRFLVAAPPRCVVAFLRHLW
jgi:hypothetical protein